MITFIYNPYHKMLTPPPVYFCIMNKTEGERLGENLKIQFRQKILLKKRLFIKNGGFGLLWCLSLLELQEVVEILKI